MARRGQRGGGRRTRRSALTLIELLLVLVLTVIIMGALSYAFMAEASMHRLVAARRSDVDGSESMEQQLTWLLKGARLSGRTGDATTFFQGISSGSGSDLGCGQITFTTTAPGVPMAAMSSTDDFETQQTARGPVGGLAEVSLSTTAVGDAGGKTGLFERLQRPGDTDPTQGGSESDIDDQINTIGFEFWDGQQWETTWDTTTMSTPRLPAAVQVSYRLTGSTDVTHKFVVTIPASDVSDANPVVQGGTSQ